MTFDKFIQKWLGNRTDQDGVYGYQCVDLIKQYALEVLGIVPGAWGNAIDYWTNTKHPLTATHDRVASQSPQKGDIVILNPTPTNSYGHIGIATSTTTMLEQNGATGDGDGRGGDEVRYRTIPTTRIAGLLRPKEEDMKTNRDISIWLWRVARYTHSPNEKQKQAWTGQDIVGLLQAIYKSDWFAKQKNAVANYDKVIQQLKDLQNKPPEVVVKEVEKIVEKEVIVEVPVGEEEAVRGFFGRILDFFFPKKG